EVLSVERSGVGSRCRSSTRISGFVARRLVHWTNRPWSSRAESNGHRNLRTVASSPLEDVRLEPSPRVELRLAAYRAATLLSVDGNGDQPRDRTTFSRASAERYDHTSSLVLDLRPRSGLSFVERLGGGESRLGEQRRASARKTQLSVLAPALCSP